MKRTFFVLLLLTAGTALQAQTLGGEYRLSRVFPVEGRQGIAADSNYYYVSGSTVLYKYDKQGRLVARNGQPFEGLPLAANHIGDIDVWNGEIYAGIETFEDGKGENIQVAVYDADDLTWKRSIDWEPASGQVEVCGLAVDRDRNMVWMADWIDGRYLYGYDLATGKYVRKVHLRPVPQWQQGIYMAGGQMLISADDGDADLDEPDNLYIADLRDGKSYAAVLPFRMMSDFRRAGEIEGLTVDPATDELLVLSNRGSRIVLGMVRGFYPGYDSELHEVYVYEKVKSEQSRKGLFLLRGMCRMPISLPPADAFACAFSGFTSPVWLPASCFRDARFRGWAFPVSRCSLCERSYFADD